MQGTHILLRTGERILVGELLKLLKSENRDFIIQGQNTCLFSEHPKPKSLDYWLRTKSGSPDTKLSDNNVLKQLEATGLFDIRSGLICPDSGEKCKGLQLRQAPETAIPKKPTHNTDDDPKTGEVGEPPTVRLRGSEKLCVPSEDGATKLVSRLAKELEPLRSTVGKNYNYKVADIAKNELKRLIGVDIPEEEPYQWNLALRGSLKGRIAGENGDGPLNEELCVWVVRDWGGTDRRNKKLTPELRDIINGRRKNWQTDETGPPPVMGFERISSWSKILALIFPETCAIYDSRTAFALNWLQFQINVKDRNAEIHRYWPVPSGTNTLLGLMNPDQLIVAHHIENLSELIEYEQTNVFGNSTGARKSGLAKRLIKSLQIEESGAYFAYCQLLRALGEKLFPEKENSLLRTEMLLFAAATQALPSSVFGYLQTVLASSPPQETSQT